jgi:hypothetical protein
MLRSLLSTQRRRRTAVVAAALRRCRKQMAAATATTTTRSTSSDADNDGQGEQGRNVASLWSRFKEQWQVGSHVLPYIPDLPDADGKGGYRNPAPG